MIIHLTNLKTKPIFISCIFLAWSFSGVFCFAQVGKLQTIAQNGWANNSVNTVIFRKNSLITYKDLQYAAFYDEAQFVVLAKRKLNSGVWEIKRTQYKGDATDAHKSISISVDGAGFLHLAWGQHNNQLNYVKSLASGSLIMGDKINMLGTKEDHVSYPEFYKLTNGDLLFLYRDGGSGNGNLMINRYDMHKQEWKRVQDNLIDGEGKRNAYWQTVVDKDGGLHLSWVWRESPDVASNHDLCYAKSIDGGNTWQKSTGEKYTLPINAKNAEYALRIPQQSELINQTAMFANPAGEIFIATYWKDAGQTVPQYHVVYRKNSAWHVNNLAFRKTPFTLSGVGTKQIPISRPQIISWKTGETQSVGLIFRDEERGNKVSIAVNKNISGTNWQVSDLTTESVGDWEPSYDTERWNKKSILNLFIQKVVQVDGEGKANAGSTPVQLLEWKPEN